MLRPPSFRIPTLLFLIFPGLCAQFEGKIDFFHPDFRKFLELNYGNETAEFLAREDVPNCGSFGGGFVGREQRAVVLIHGLRNQAGSLWKVREKFADAGVPFELMFATTWGRGETSDLALDESMRCSHIRQIRYLIEAVANYTQREVDVIGYSMGSPMARKAIMGGKCVEEDFDLGGPLTDRINTFVSVAGANRGSYLCSLPFFDVCNFRTGLSCGSMFLQDIASKWRYEGKHVYNVASELDDVVGYEACDGKVSQFRGAVEVKANTTDHETTEFETYDLQLSLLRKKYPVFGFSKKRVEKEGYRKKFKKTPWSGDFRLRKRKRMSRKSLQKKRRFLKRVFNRA